MFQFSLTSTLVETGFCVHISSVNLADALQYPRQRKKKQKFLSMFQVMILSISQSILHRILKRFLSVCHSLLQTTLTYVNNRTSTRPHNELVKIYHRGSVLQNSSTFQLVLSDFIILLHIYFIITLSILNFRYNLFFN